MINYMYIQKEWIVSPFARRFYRATARGSVAFLFFAVFVAMGFLPAFFAPLAKALLLAGALSTGATMLGMECFLFLFDNKSLAYKQVFWFFMMLLPLGATIFCFLVYSRSSAFVSTPQDSSFQASA